MSLSPELRARLVCPRCRGELVHEGAEEAGEERLICRADRLAYPVVDGVPWLVPEKARPLTPGSA